MEFSKEWWTPQYYLYCEFRNMIYQTRITWSNILLYPRLPKNVQRDFFKMLTMGGEIDRA